MYSILVLVKQDYSIVLIEEIFKTFLCWTFVWRLPSPQVKLKIYMWWKFGGCLQFRLALSYSYLMCSLCTCYKLKMLDVRSCWLIYNANFTFPLSLNSEAVLSQAQPKHRMRKCLATRWLSPRRETSFQGEKPVVMSPETPVSGSRSIRGYVWKKKIYDSKGKFRLMKVSVTLLDIQVLKYMYIVLILVWFFCPFLCYIIWFSQNVNTKIRIRGKCNLKPNIYFIFHILWKLIYQ